MKILEPELTEYITKIIKSVCRFSSLPTKGAIQNSTLYFLIDNSILYEVHAPALNNDIVTGFDVGEEVYYEHSGMLNTRTNYFESLDTWKYIMNMYNSIVSEYSVLSFSDPLLLQNEEYYKLITNLKAPDGNMFYNVKTIDNCISIPIFTGLPLVSKGDTLALNIYSSPFENSRYIVNYNIFKKKINMICKVYFKIINLNRNLRSC